MIPLLPVKLRLLVQEDLPLLMKEPFPVPDLIKLLPDRGFLFGEAVVAALVTLIVLVVLVVLVGLVELIHRLAVSPLHEKQEKDAGLPRMERCPAPG